MFIRLPAGWPLEKGFSSDLLQHGSPASGRNGAVGVCARGDFLDRLPRRPRRGPDHHRSGDRIGRPRHRALDRRAGCSDGRSRGCHPRRQRGRRDRRHRHAVPPPPRYRDRLADRDPELAGSRRARRDDDVRRAPDAVGEQCRLDEPELDRLQFRDRRHRGVAARPDHRQHADPVRRPAQRALPARG